MFDKGWYIDNTFEGRQVTGLVEKLFPVERKGVTYIITQGCWQWLRAVLQISQPSWNGGITRGTEEPELVESTDCPRLLTDGCSKEGWCVKEHSCCFTVLLNGIDWIIHQVCIWAWRNVLGKHENLNDKKRIASQRILILLLPAETRKFRGSKNEIKENVNGNFEPRKGLVWVLKDSLTWLITAPKYYCYDLQAFYVFVIYFIYIIFSLLFSNS